MKAAVLYGSKNLVVENVNDPVLDPDGVIVRVKACGICGSDLHTYHQGGLPGAPRIMGHEFSGEVVEVGCNVTGFKKGDRLAGRGGRAFAEYVGIPQMQLDRRFECWTVELPGDMSWEVGATTEPVSVGVNAAKRAEPKHEDIAVVLGAGIIGQCVWQAFKALGVSKVIVSEMGRKRIEAARLLGADIVIDATKENPVNIVNEITSGEGADIVADCAGTASTLQQATAMVRGGGYWHLTHQTWKRMAVDIVSDGGKIMQVATSPGIVEWQPALVAAKGVRLIGCIVGRVDEAMALMRAGKIITKQLITHEFPLDRITEAFELQAKPDETVKVIIKP